MFAQDVRLDRFLRSVYGVEPFLEYCRRNGIPFDKTCPSPMPVGSCGHLVAALARLPWQQRAQVEWELAQVHELTDRESGNHLLAAIEGKDMPADLIPGGAALAFWFLLHHPDIFHAVYLHQEIFEADAWRNAQTTCGQVIDDLQGKATLLAASLQEFFQRSQGTGRFCTVESSLLDGAYCFVGHVADRVQLVEAFTEEGEQTLQRLRPAFPVLFVYYPQDGTILLKSPLESDHLIRELFRRFGQIVLGAEPDYRCCCRPFALDTFKAPIHLLPDAEDMESVRVKTLHFRYPERQGRRQIKLETVASDEVPAIPHLIRTHLSGEGVLDQLQVCYAELQVVLKIPGDQSKSYLIHLWPNRSNLSQSALGERFRACLKRWGITHVKH